MDRLDKAGVLQGVHISLELQSQALLADAAGAVHCEHEGDIDLGARHGTDHVGKGRPPAAAGRKPAAPWSSSEGDRHGSPSAPRETSHFGSVALPARATSLACRAPAAETNPVVARIAIYTMASLGLERGPPEASGGRSTKPICFPRHALTTTNADPESDSPVAAKPSCRQGMPLRRRGSAFTEFTCCDQQSRGWRASARHDGKA